MHKKTKFSLIFTLITVLLILFIAVPASQASEPITLTMLTLDDRPPNNLLVKELAAIAGINLIVEFGPSSAPDADLVSINAAACGSLVGSRTSDPWLLQPPVVRPDAYLHFAVPRVQPTVADQSLKTEYDNVMTLLQDPDMQRNVLSAIKGEEISFENQTIGAYVDRMRGWIDFLRRGNYDPDRLLITLDDNRPGPLSDGIKLILGEFSDYVYDGTDEGMMLLLARALRDREENPASTIPIIFTNPADLVTVQPFESALSIENIFSMADWLQMRISPAINLYEQWRPVLWIHGTGTETADTPALIRSALSTVGERKVIVADIRVNGGDPVLFDEWKTGATPSGLLGYVGWNTSSKTLGTEIALWASVDFAYAHSSDPEGVASAIEVFLWARILDDYFYQRVVRAEMYNVSRESGGDPWNLSDEQTLELARLITEKLAALWTENEGALSIPLRFVQPSGSTGFIVELPWNRLFEIELYPTDSRGILPVINPID
ncbi:MAG: DUF4127 family protein [bacterium]|nr:DUF4127 family protein [bacterium]